MQKTTDDIPPPPSMDKWSRNERLYDQLLNMGLFCSPIFDSEGRIEAIYVAAELPSRMPGVGVPMQRTKVAKGITSAFGDRTNVVDFPTIL